ncbi:MAG: pentapeptide repeat-containing protein [Blastocatellia bacterium]|nr:pentapeptide repeat-containing protein [Blastocatellia bacterium]
MTTNLIDRWKATPNLFRKLSSRNCGSPEALSDLRGIPYGNRDVRTSIRSLQLSYVDLSYATFQNCNFFDMKFIGCHFAKVDFTNLRQWNCKYLDCTFEKSDFRNATMGVATTFEGSTFASCKLKGKHFSFGSQNLFKETHFSKCEIGSAWIDSVRFEKCILSSKFKNVRFSGSFEASLDPDKKEFPATFLECDLSKSVFEDVEIMDGAVIYDTALPDQKSERFNNDRLCYH